MTTTTPILGLTLYDSTTDQAVLFATYRAQISGPSVSSNFYKIDTEIGDIQTDITALQAFKGAIPVPAVYISANYYEATGITSIASYTSGTVIILSLDTSSSGTVTLNINALGTKSVMKVNSAGTKINLTGVDLVINNYYLFMYDGTQWVWVSANSAATGAEIDTGTDVTKYATPKAIADSSITTASKSQTLTNKTLGTTQLGEVSIKLDAALSADGTWCGVTEIGTAGTQLWFGDVCYFQASDSRWERFDSNSATCANKRLGMCVLAAAGDGSATEMLLTGKIRADSRFVTMVIGDPMYGGNPGDMSASKTLYAFTRQMGYAITADEFFFNPQPLSPRTVSEIVLLRHPLYGLPSQPANTYVVGSVAATSNITELFLDTAWTSSLTLIKARWILIWRANAPGATVSGVRLCKWDSGYTNLEILSTFEENYDEYSIFNDNVDITTEIQTVLTQGKQIGHQLKGDGSNVCTIYSSIIQLLWV